MPVFKYKGFRKDGMPVKGMEEADSKQILLSTLASKGIFVSEITENIQEKKRRRIPLLSAKKCSDDYYFQLSLLLKSGIPLVDAHKIIVKNTTASKQRDVLTDIITKVSEGIKFSDALSVHKDYFDPLYINLIRASELVGRLPNVLSDISEYEENKNRQSDKLKSAIIYPLTVTFIGLCILIFMLTVIVPKIQNIFASAGKEIPAVTRILLSISSFTQTYGILIFIIILILLITFGFLYKTNETLKMSLDKKLFKVKFISQSYITRFSHVLSFQLKEGLPLSEALYHSAKTVENAYFIKELAEIRTRVQEGVKFSTSVTMSGIFPDLFPAAISTGESSGNMPELLERVSEFMIKIPRNILICFCQLLNRCLSCS